MSVYNNNIS